MSPAFVRQEQLLAPFLLLPLLFALACLDRYVLQDALQQKLPSSPHDLVGYGLLFGLPHIVGSFLTLADKEYFEAYKQRLAPTALIAAGLTALTMLYLPPAAGLVLLTVVNVRHTMGQQAGLARGMLGRVTSAYGHWRISAMMLAFLIPAYALSNTSNTPWPVHAFLEIGLGCLAAASCVAAAFVVRQQPSIRNAFFLMATQGLMVLCLLLVMWGYPVFAILAPQVIHDLNAFTVYIAHDRRRLLDATPQKNAVYRVLRASRRSLPALMLSLSVLIAAALTHSGLALVAVWLSITHYLFEARMWMRGSPHRQRLAFRP